MNLKSIKHNKKRNTFFLMEVLLTELTAAVVNQDKDQVLFLKKIIKETFSQKTELGKEYKLYKTILETKNYPKELARQVLYEAKHQFSKLDRKKVFKEQTRLLTILNEKFAQDIFLNFVSNYKEIATLNQIFQNDMPPREKILLEAHFVKRMSMKEEEKAETVQSEQVNSLVIRKFCENFNEQYSTLLTEQKELLQKFILSQTNEADYIVYLNKEVKRLKETLQNIKSDEFSDKIQSTVSLLENFSKKTNISDEDLTTIMTTQELVRELGENGKNSPNS